MTKVETGITGLDALLYGGINEGASVLVEGVPGAGKTTLALEFIYHGASRYDEAGVIITFEQFPEQFYRDAANFGWDLRDLERKNKLRVVCTSPELLLDPGSGLLEEIVEEIDARRVVIDSVTHFANVLQDYSELRPAVYSLCNGLKRMGLTALLIKEIGESYNQAIPFEEYVVDAVIRLTNAEGIASQRTRYIEILKTRGQKHIAGKHSFKIEQQGIKIYSLNSLITKSDLPSGSAKLVPTGIEGLDSLLRGGIPAGHAVIVGGGSGTGKTILALQFLINGALLFEEKGVYLSFEEHPEQIYNNAGAFGWDLPHLERDNLVKVSYTRPVNLNFDEQVIKLGESILNLGAKRVVIDSLQALAANTKSDENIQREKIYLLVSYLTSLGCTTFLLSNLAMNEQSGYSVEESLVNGTILLKSTFEKNRRTRYLEVFKMRGINHITGNHIMEISDRGVQVYPRVGEVF